MEKIYRQVSVTEVAKSLLYKWLFDTTQDRLRYFYEKYERLEKRVFVLRGKRYMICLSYNLIEFFLKGSSCVISREMNEILAIL